VKHQPVAIGGAAAWRGGSKSSLFERRRRVRGRALGGGVGRLAAAQRPESGLGGGVLADRHTDRAIVAVELGR
jgi:hypothetical protein